MARNADQYPDIKCLAEISIKNGFTRAEVTRIRKEIRELYDAGKVLRHPSRIIEAFIWEDTPQGIPYWMEISIKIHPEEEV